MIQELNKQFIEEEILDSSSKPNANYFYKLKQFNILRENILQTMYDVYNSVNSPSCICGNNLPFISYTKGYKDFCCAKCRNSVIKKLKTNREYTKNITLTRDNISFFIKNNKINKNVLHLIIPPEYSFVDNTSEYIYCFENNITSKPLCSCGDPLKYRSYAKGYSKGCSSKCTGGFDETKNKRQRSVTQKYGVEFVSQLEESKQKSRETKLVNHGSETYNNKEKYRKTCIEKYGVDNIFKDTEYRKVWENKRVESIRNNSKNDNNWITRPENVDNNLEKRIQTCLNTYGVEHYMQSENAQEQMQERVDKIWTTKKKNGTTNTSIIENEIYNILIKKYKVVHREYKDNRYPFRCDFYIEDIDLFIEYHGYFTHGKDIFLNSEEDIKLLENWKHRGGSFYQNAIINWSISDVKKRNHAIKNDLNFLEIFNVDKNNLEYNILTQIKRVFEISIPFSNQELLREHHIVKAKRGDLLSKPSHNKIIKHFHKHFYLNEQKLYSNPTTRRKLIKNRITYLSKKEYELTNRELLSGFKISGIHTGYSFFSPLWFKYFIEKYDVKRVYDPFGGWGHRMMGANTLELYIYNDLSMKTYNGVNKIKEFLNINNVITYNNDASSFIPTENYDAVFTCPPYEDIEKYENKIVDFKKLMVDSLTNSYLNSNANICGIIIKESFEDLMIEILGDYVSKEIVNNKINHFNNKKTFEYLYIWKKY